MKNLVLIFSILFTPFANSLELDQKLVVRLLGVSESKKTLLVNKGKEQGLKLGDHAKMSLPTGMIARGVVVKLSPSRSVWSVYRFFNKAKLEPMIALTLKIATAVKLTTDETKRLGILARKYRKKKEAIPIEEMDLKKKKEQNDIRKTFLKTKRVISQFDNEDYSLLTEPDTFKKRNADVDWASVDGLRDLSNVDPNVDFTTVR